MTHFTHFGEALDKALEQVRADERWAPDAEHGAHVEFSAVINPGQIIIYSATLVPGG